MTYYEKLQDPQWQKTRLKVLERDNFTCICCGETTKQLHVHHCYYVSRRNPWEYHLNTMVTLCFDCHKSVDEPASPSNSMCTVFEPAVIAEMSRQLSNIRNGSDHDEGTLHEFCRASHYAGWPVPEALNVLRDASFLNLINDKWLVDLSKQVVAIKKQLASNQ
tara:strand:- start:721 stop:1209 length:489 start_codon:yes stop_codon:yes gene_type:complete